VPSATDRDPRNDETGRRSQALVPRPAFRPRAPVRADIRVWVPRRGVLPPTSLRDAALLLPMLLVIVLANIVLFVLLAVMLVAALVFLVLAALGLSIHRARSRRS
jgi:hypothetical protein